MDDPAPPAARRSDRSDLLLALALFAAALGILRLRADPGRPLASDEPEWIAISILHWRQITLGEPPAGAELDPPGERAESPWMAGVQRTTFGYMNPGLPKLLWGAVLWAGGHREASPLAFQIFHRDRPAEGLAAQRALQPAAPLARWVVLALAGISAVLVFFVVRDGFGDGAGRGRFAAALAAYGLLLASPLVRGTADYLRTDFFMLPFVLGALHLCIRRRDALSGRRGARVMALSALGLGLLTGLAVSAKFNGALLGFAVALWIPLLWWSARREHTVGFAEGPLASLLVAGLACCAVFYALDPVLWSQPLEGVRAILERWERLMGFFREEWGPRTGAEVPDGRIESASLFLRRVFARDEPLGARTVPLVGALACTGGLAFLLAQLLRLRPFADTSTAARERAAMVLVFAAVFIAGTALWLPIDWARFFLPAIPCLVLLEGWLVGGVVRVGIRGGGRL